MAARGLAGRSRRRKIRTTITDPTAAGAVVDRLGRAFDPAKLELDRIYVGDIACIRTQEGWLCLVTCLDLASRQVVGFAMANHMRASLVCDALAMAVDLRHPTDGFIFHSDRGSQYTSGDFRNLLAKHHGLQSLSRPRQCRDDAVAESFFATLNEEVFHRETLATREAARRAIFEFIAVFYNRSRLHSTLGYLTQAEYEEQSRKLPEAA